MSVKLAHDASTSGEARGADRQPCEVHTTCQPPSAWAKDPWPATIRNIGTSGLSLTLPRRFERGSGLAIELPSDDGSTSTILARVVHVSPFPEGGWLLGVSFVSELSDEEVRQVIHHSDRKETGGAPPAPSPRSVSGVLFQARYVIAGEKELLRWFIKHLDHTGEWPPAAGKVLGMRLIGGGKPVRLMIRKCQLFGSYWIVDCKLVEALDAATLRMLGGA